MPAPRADREAERAWPSSTRRRRVLLVAGEASGDLHAADLVTALREHEPPPVTGWDGLRALEVAHVIRESVETEARAAQAATS